MEAEERSSCTSFLRGFSVQVVLRKFSARVVARVSSSRVLPRVMPLPVRCYSGAAQRSASLVSLAVSFI